MKVATINVGLNEAFILVVVGFTGENNQSGSIEVRLDRNNGLLSDIKEEALEKARSELAKIITVTSP